MVFSCNVQAEEILTATTDDGRKVVLFPDGTWVYKPIKESFSDTSKLSKPKTANAYLKSKLGGYEIHYNNKKWKKFNYPQIEDEEFMLIHKEKEVLAAAVFEQVNLPELSLKNIIIERIKLTSESIHILKECTKLVNGNVILVLKISCIPYELKFSVTTLGYYYSFDNWGTLQICGNRPN